jgi:hypothetical protein
MVPPQQQVCQTRHEMQVARDSFHTCNLIANKRGSTTWSTVARNSKDTCDSDAITKEPQLL